MKELRICIIGAAGRMGQVICTESEAFRSQEISGVRIIGGIVGKESKAIGSRVAEIEEVLTNSWEASFAVVNVLIDFSEKEGTRKALGFAREQGLPIVVGTTGLDTPTEDLVKMTAEQVPVLRATNMSLGIAVMGRLAQEAAEMLGPAFDCELVELHHRLKKDAPSGTALALGALLTGGTSMAQEALCFGREGQEALRKPGEIGFHAVRGGDVAGEHTIYFLGDGERLEITHRVSNRKVFALGALRGAAWLLGKKPGLYTMADVV